MKPVALILVLAALLSSCATRQACVEVSPQKAPNLKNMGFVLTKEQDQKLCELEQTTEQKTKKECGKPYQVIFDRETVLKAAGKRSRDLVSSISCK